MPIHVVKPGDTLIRLAHQYGFTSWRAIYEHADNAALRERRPNPHQLLAGDRVVIPAKKPKEVTVPSGTTQKFQLKRLRAAFRLVVEDESGRPLKGGKFTLKIDDKTIEGEVGDDGVVALDIEPDPKIGRLTVFPAGKGRKLTYKLALGQLAPIDTMAGVRARLANLGFDPGGPDGELDAIARSALRAFQIVANLKVTGQIDDATRAALAKAHDKGAK